MLLSFISYAQESEYPFNPIYDAYVDSANPTTNYGTTGDLAITGTAGTCGGERRAWFRYDLSSLSGSTVIGAKVRLVHDAVACCCPTFIPNTDSYQINSPSGSCSWNETGMTWNSQCAIGSSLGSHSMGNVGSFAVGQVQEETFANGSAFVNYVNTRTGGTMDFVIRDNSANAAGTYQFGSKDNGNSAYRPILYLTTTAPPPGIGNASVTGYVIPSLVRINRAYPLTVAFQNTGSSVTDYKVGLSIGKNSTGQFCNSDCYAGGQQQDASNITWFGIVHNVLPNETRIVTTYFNFTSAFFESYNSYDVRIAIRPYDSLNVLDLEEVLNVTYVSFLVPPTGVDAEIVNVTFEDSNPTVGQTVPVDIKIKNTGDVEYDFYVGLSIGDYDSYVFCNRDCYSDCDGGRPRGTVLCDYGRTGTIHPNQTVTVRRLFGFLSQNFEQGNYYDTLVTVAHDSYLGLPNSLDNRTLLDNIYITPVEQKLSMYAISAQASTQSISTGKEITVRAFIFNNDTITYNVTIGLSLGIWNVPSGKVWTQVQPPVIVPCNTECFTDDIGSWVFKTVPRNYTVPVTRSFVIPDYFPEGSAFDVAIGIYTSPADQFPAGKLISFTVIKDMATVTSQPLANITVPNVVDTGTDLVGQLLGVNTSLALVFIGIVTSVAVGGYLALKTNSGMIGSIAVLALFILFSVFGWIPIWVTIIFAVIASFIVARYVREAMSGG
jgi:hypothetical protein